MKKIFLFTFLIASITSCGNDAGEEVLDQNETIVKPKEGENDEDLSSIKVESDYDLSTVEAKDRREFKENLAKIEKKHGIQWDFCTCVLKNDSINSAFMEPALPDEKFDKLAERLDEIDMHCKAFLSQSSTQTPEERAKHEKKVKDCLKSSTNLP